MKSYLRLREANTRPTHRASMKNQKQRTINQAIRISLTSLKIAGRKRCKKVLSHRDMAQISVNSCMELDLQSFTMKGWINFKSLKKLRKTKIKILINKN